ncbi:uncharacterized protein LACBIDRAFT_251219 [Laccaria bicolor S238N-H82]|uniref:Hydrophobin n=1 Tax=Laccaria bicolor (strain S238N-H82 / ATCC MYA-4686) TaxID=486041 RepID=B0DG13_LACBS|nr:uncharacterized protein LACBIDRAFT_251219 [Laccaria bicolor S238N-H82]EDR06561.1 predicted protein [Laccaria bicolor S238N-H82]|eukprot:XP_001882933.1 predicted protein [Laccaria bicolor S238N-H82]
MQFSRISTALVLLVLTTFYAPVPTPPPASQCDTSALWCCNETQSSNGNVVGALLALLGIVVDPISALVGSGCSSINALGVGVGGMCTAQPVCCQNNNFASLVVIGCTPVTLGA